MPQFEPKENHREALLVLRDVLDVKCEPHTRHRTMEDKTSAGVMCFTDVVSTDVIAKYRCRRHDKFDHMPNTGNATLMLHVVFASRSEKADANNLQVLHLQPKKKKLLQRRTDYLPCITNPSVLWAVKSKSNPFQTATEARDENERNEQIGSR